MCDWLLNSSWDHLGLHQGKMVRGTMEFELPKRHISRPTLSSNMVQRVLLRERQKRCSSRKRQGPMAEKCCYNKILMNFFWRREDEDKRRQVNGQTCFFFFFSFQNYPFWTYARKKSAHSLLSARSFLLIQLDLHLVRDPKAL